MEDLKCKYCGKVHESKSTMESKKIIQRKFNPSIRKQYIGEDFFWFCKGTGCGGKYQMGCEG